ncbi:MAG: TetR/AcrR family transcriptional regulator [Anaerolineales bacterium]|jgi:AcrR family transcriptional regulator
MQRSDIIQAAAQIFRQKGYHGTSMQDIADSVQLQKASLYHHVSSKQEILLSILDQALEGLIEDLEQIVASQLPADQKLRKAMQSYIERMMQDTDLAAVLLLEYRSLEPDQRQDHVARRDKYESLWRQIVIQGVRTGVFREMDISVSTFALLGVQNWTITWFQEDGRLTAKELADLYCDLFLSGIRKGNHDDTD